MQSEIEGSQEKVVRGESGWDMKKGIPEEATCVLQAVSVPATPHVNEGRYAFQEGMVDHLQLTG